ncbi:hypothetical protein DID88_000289 [Monilinia fructigena]|uniref:Apurinic-apyrimidinic endonuclease 1 n=1 Tax=Monilinia fructigena TaxID=38457 RepID=A0A395IHL4_9HELO|nr:hypothetical protein DID88_000289 [Monilinia fructigena]
MLRDAALATNNHLDNPATTTRNNNDRDLIDLWDWVRHGLTVVMSESLYGAQNPYRDPEIEAGFWTLSNGSMNLLLPNFLSKVIASKTICGRDVVVNGFRRYFHSGDYLKGSKLVKSRYELLVDKTDDTHADLTHADLAKHETISDIAAFSNTSPTMFWVIYQLFSDPLLLKEVRTQVERITTSEISTQGETIHKIDLKKLHQPPILNSMIMETLRFHSTGTGPRQVLADTSVGQDQYLLKKDSIVIIAKRRLHFDKSVWGETADTFRPDRFCEKTPLNAFRAFGGGVNTCPGKAFVTPVIAAFVGMLAMRFDIMPDGNQWIEPAQDISKISAQIAPPIKKVLVDLAPRAGIDDTPARQTTTGDKNSATGATPRRDGATASALGSRMRSSIPMTPRSVGGVDFARQIAEQRALGNPSQPKKFRSVAAPKGSKLAAGYTDRTKNRIDEDEDDKASRVKALEEMMKLQQIDEATFLKLRDEILGGDVESTHLVKGLDYKLLERVRRGEDVLSGKNYNEDEPEETEDLDDEFERLEEKDVVAVEKEKSKKKGEMAPPSLIPGKKRTRDQILAEMKAARQAAKEAAQPSLGARFKKVGEPKSTTRIERDGKGREVLIVVDENGNEKRKVRKVQLESEVVKGNGLLMPDKDAKPLGMEVPEVPKEPEPEEEDIDIFDDAGDDYDPLAGLEEEESESDEGAEDGEVTEDTERKKGTTRDSPQELRKSGSMTPPPLPSKPRNYFGDSEPATTENEAKPRAFSDPTILAALKKASTLNPIAKTPESAEEAAKEARRKKMLQRDDRDMEDMDMGFGSSRFEDEADFDETKVKLSAWGGEDDEDEKGDGKSKRKRGGKKRKGDANSAADVMKIVENTLETESAGSALNKGGNDTKAETTEEGESIVSPNRATKITKTAALKRKLKKEDKDEDEDEQDREIIGEKKAIKKRKTKEDKDAETMSLAGRTLVSTLKKAVHIGAHVSAAGGVQNSVTNSLRIGGNAFALFLKSQRKWVSPPMAAEARDQFKTFCKEQNYDASKYVLPHCSYLVNLAQPDEVKAKQAYDCFLDDLKRCEELGINLYNFHPGSTGGNPRPEAIARIAAQLNKAHKATKSVITLLENMAGAGNVIGCTWEDLRDIIALVDDKSRVGVCLDTCHTFAAGYDLRSPEAFKKTMDDFSKIVGLQYLKALHLNDSKSPLASNRDLHANIGTGFLGLRAFHNVINFEPFQNMPMVLETPNEKKDANGKNVEDPSMWATEIKLLEGLLERDPESKEFKEEEKRLQDLGASERQRVQVQVDKKKQEVLKKGQKTLDSMFKKRPGKKSKKEKKGSDDEDSEDGGCSH